MKFSKDYSKLDKLIFTTIRKNTRHYRLPRRIWNIQTPTRKFKAYLIKLRKLKKKQITEKLARSDGDCSKAELIAMLEGWYGKEFDDFVLLTFQKESE
ncbi:unnamed protein product [marine sediment metagenome]|uniref:Uncharacterized protein n=1 Tax=marine sediment metagenome TaxID=412755 RepID=X1ITH2_9ZZZZ